MSEAAMIHPRDLREHDEVTTFMENLLVQVRGLLEDDETDYQAAARNQPGRSDGASSGIRPADVP